MTSGGVAIWSADDVRVEMTEIGILASRIGWDTLAGEAELEWRSDSLLSRTRSLLMHATVARENGPDSDSEGWASLAGGLQVLHESLSCLANSKASRTRRLRELHVRRIERAVMQLSQRPRRRVWGLPFRWFGRNRASDNGTGVNDSLQNEVN